MWAWSVWERALVSKTQTSPKGAVADGWRAWLLPSKIGLKLEREREWYLCRSSTTSWGWFVSVDPVSGHSLTCTWQLVSWSFAVVVVRVLNVSWGKSFSWISFLWLRQFERLEKEGGKERVLDRVREKLCWSEGVRVCVVGKEDIRLMRDGCTDCACGKGCCG